MAINKLKKNTSDSLVDIYIRVSTQEQALDGYSIGEQEDRLRAYCIAMGYQIYQIRTDPGFSGASLDRPGIKQVIKDVQSGRVQKVIVWKLDRLSRSQKDTLILLEDVFITNNCDFISLMESFDTSTPFGRAIIGILAAFAQLERESIKERTYMGKQARTREGHFNGSRPPLGYDFAPGTNDLVINPYEAGIVREVFQLFLSGKSIGNIFRHMSEKYGNCNYVWSNNTAVRRLLCNQTYAGKVTLGDLCCDGIHESIISEEDFLMVNTMLEHNQRISKRTYDFKSGHYKTDALLTGLLYCGDCGARMTSRKVSEKTRRYICHSVSRNNKLMIKSDNCSNRLHPFTQTQLDEIILNEICKLSLDQTKFESIVNYAPEINTPEMQVYEDRLTDIEKQIHRLLNLYQTGLIPMDDIAGRVTPLKEEKEKLQKIIQDQSLSSPPIAPDDAWDMLTSFDDVLENGNSKEVHKIVHSLIDRIIVLNDEIVIHWSFC